MTYASISKEMRPLAVEAVLAVYCAMYYTDKSENHFCITALNKQQLDEYFSKHERFGNNCVDATSQVLAPHLSREPSIASHRGRQSNQPVQLARWSVGQRCGNHLLGDALPRRRQLDLQVVSH